MIRALIVDDEQPARDRLRRLLDEVPGVEVAGEAVDGEHAMEQIAALDPEVVFLGIQMPGCSGLEVAASLPGPRPRIVFCTAFDRYAVDAFELHAIDYLLKPVSRARLARTLARVTEAPPAETSPDRMANMPLGAPSRFLARKGATYRVVPAREVLYFLSEGGLTKLQTETQHYWMSPTLNDLEARLGNAEFFRVSRAALVQLDAVREVAPIAGGHGQVTLRDGTTLEVSRRRFRELTARLGDA